MGRSLQATKNVDRYVKLLNDFFAEREYRGVGVPESTRTKGVCGYAFIANELRVPVRRLKYTTELRECISNWTQKIGFSPIESSKIGPPARATRAKECRQKADAYLERLRREGKKLPENPASPGNLDWERIAREADLPLVSLAPNRSSGKRIREAAAELGLGTYPESDDVHVITYGQLFEQGSQWREEELRGKRSHKQQLYNTRSRFRFFMVKAGEVCRSAQFEEHDPVGEELLERAEEVERAITKGITSKATRNTFAKELRRWKGYLLRLRRSQDLPDQFAAALNAAIDRARISISRLAEESGMHAQTIYTWLYGVSSPAVEMYPKLRKIEELLGLAPDALVSKLARGRPKNFPSSAYPEHVIVGEEVVTVRNNSTIRHSLRALLPDDYDLRSEEERVEIAAWIIENLIRPTTEWGRWQREVMTAEYLLKELPPLVKEEWRSLAEFKCGKLAPQGMKRSGTWSESSEQLHRKNLRGFFGFLSLPRDADDCRERGLGVDLGDVSIAMLACPKLIHAWVRWCGKRRGDENIAESFSYYDLRFLETVIQHVTPAAGWLRQNPRLAEHLKPIPGFIDDFFIARAQEHWDGVCDDAMKAYQELAAELEEVVEEQRNPFEPILPLLDVAHPLYHNPIAALRAFSQNIINDMPDPSRAPGMAARCVRNYLITRILSATGLRSRNLRELTYREDNTGQLRMVRDKWVITIPWQKFKNKHSSFFGTKRKKHDYEKQLADTDGLYKWIEEYIRVHRPLLLKSNESDSFFINSAENPMLTVNIFHSVYRRLTRNYFAHNPYRGRGIPGVKPHGPHSVRSMIATYIIQQTGSYELAAYAIGDSPRTVREHYARFRPKDKTRLIDLLLTSAWESGRDALSLMGAMTHDRLLAQVGLP